jgi:hypothetical protein
LIRVVATCSNFGMHVKWRALAAFALVGGAPAVAVGQPSGARSAGAAAATAKPRSAAPHGRPAAATDAVLPGFEALADGSTRLFIEFTGPVTYDAKPAHGSITYVLKGAHVDRRNNYNPLVTVHFNTPVTSARLVPHGRDLWFVVALRADVQPTVSVDAAKDGGSVMRIEFPKGDYVPSGAGAPPPADSAAAAQPTPRTAPSEKPAEADRSDH